MTLHLAPAFNYVVLSLALTLSAACAPKSAPRDAGTAPSAAADAPAASSDVATEMPAADSQNDLFPDCIVVSARYYPQDISGTYIVAGEEQPTLANPAPTPSYTGEVTISLVQEHCFHAVWETDGPDRIATLNERADGTFSGYWIGDSLKGKVYGSIQGGLGEFQLETDDLRSWHETLAPK